MPARWRCRFHHGNMLMSSSLQSSTCARPLAYLALKGWCSSCALPFSWTPKCRCCAQRRRGAFRLHIQLSLWPLAAFPGAHWSALAPASPLRRFRLINLHGLPQVPVTQCQLHIEERVVHYVAGISYLDESLQGEWSRSASRLRSVILRNLLRQP